MHTDGRHLDRLTSVDASFLTNESSNSHMHVGAILIFEGPPPKYVDLVEHVRGQAADDSETALLTEALACCPEDRDQVAERMLERSR